MQAISLSDLRLAEEKDRYIKLLIECNKMHPIPIDVSFIC
jgi:hypothetical protein